MGLFIRELASFKCVAKIEDFLLDAKENPKNRQIFYRPEITVTEGHGTSQPVVQILDPVDHTVGPGGKVPLAYRQ